MAKDDLARVDGVVTDILSGGIFSVKITTGQIVMARLSGRMRRFHIRVILGDRVSVGMSPYDLTHGLILSREKVASHRPSR